MFRARASLVAHLHMWTLILVLTIVRHNPSAYNIDSSNAKIFRDPMHASSGRGSYFGFSVALYVGANESLLLVGAPRANSSKLLVQEPGVVFKCKLDGICTEWLIDETGNGPDRYDRRFNLIKDNAWIGATVIVQNKTEARVMVCGPRFINNIIDGNRPNWQMNGVCYMTLAINADAFARQATNRWIPLSDAAEQIAFENAEIYLGQSGFSLLMNSRYADDVIIGMPGSYEWKGSIGILNNYSSLHEARYFSRSTLSGNQEIHSHSYLGKDIFHIATSSLRKM